MDITLDRLFEDYLHHVSRTNNDKISGYVDHQENYAQFWDMLKSTGYSFSIRGSVTSKRQKCPQPLFQLKKKKSPIEFFGTPFIVEKISYFHCAYGPKYYGKQTKKQGDHPPHVKTRIHMIDTKKHNCPATMVVKKVRVFPGYSVKSNTRSSKEKACLKLKEALNSAEVIECYERFYIDCSVESLHTHPKRNNIKNSVRRERSTDHEPLDANIKVELVGHFHEMIGSEVSVENDENPMVELIGNISETIGSEVSIEKDDNTTNNSTSQMDVILEKIRETAQDIIDKTYLKHTDINFASNLLLQLEELNQSFGETCTSENGLLFLPGST